MKFVEDQPSKQLVRHLARVYLQNDTAIVPVLRALVASRSFQRSHDKKVRDPGEDVVATYRALGVKIQKPAGEEADGSALQALVWQSDSIGIAPFSWGQPNGQPIDNESWSSPARLLASMRFHLSASRRAGPTRRPSTGSPSSGCRAGTRASTSSSTTSASSCCTSSPPRSSSRPAAWPSTCKPYEAIDKDHDPCWSGSSRGSSRPCSTLPTT